MFTPQTFCWACTQNIWRLRKQTQILHINCLVAIPLHANGLGYSKFPSLLWVVHHSNALQFKQHLFCPLIPSLLFLGVPQTAKLNCVPVALLVYWNQKTSGISHVFPQPAANIAKSLIYWFKKISQIQEFKNALICTVCKKIFHSYLLTSTE